MTLEERFNNTHASFQQKVISLADQYGKSVQQVYAWWREYSDTCQCYDQSAVFGEFTEWYAEKLKAAN